MKTLVELVKYGIVGVSNTLATAVVIYILMKLFGCGSVVSNIAGYAAGVLNSFIWNKRWTFRSDAPWVKSAVRFGIAFGVCYILQLALLLSLDRSLNIDPYYNQLIAMVFYTAINFLANKYYTFKK